MNEIRSSVPGILKERKENFRITFATIDDVDTLVSLHYNCFTKKDHIALRFGKPFLRATYKWFITSPGKFVVVAKDGDRLLGFQTVSDQPYDVPMLRAGWREALIGILSQPWLVFNSELIGRLWRWLFQRNKSILGNDQEAQLAFIGVDPQARGRGIGRALVIAAVKTCRERGLNLITTGVMRDNMRSLAMLKGAGFVEAPELGTKRLVRLRFDSNKDGTPSKS